MGPKTAAKVVEKVTPKDEAQVFYVKVKMSAPAPAPAAVVPPPVTSVPTASTAASLTAGEAPVKAAPKSPTKKDKEPVPTPASEPTVTPAEEMQEAAFEIIVNLLCRTDIVIDYIRRQFVKVIQEKLAAEDPDKKIGDALRTKLKNVQSDLTSKSSSDLVLRDAAGVDIVFKEVRKKIARPRINDLVCCALASLHTIVCCVVVLI